MATRAFIAIKENNRYEAIYHHNDSYPEYLGILLLKYYKNIDKVKKAISLGDASFWGKSIHPSQKINDGEYKLPEVSFFYSRDRGESGCEPTFHQTLKNLKIAAFNSFAEYLYVFDSKLNTWFMYNLKARNKSELLEIGDYYG